MFEQKAASPRQLAPASSRLDRSPDAASLNGRGTVVAALAVAERLNARGQAAARAPQAASANSEAPIQRAVYADMPSMWAAVAPGDNLAQINAPIAAEPELGRIAQDVTAHLPQMEFLYQAGRQPEAAVQPDPGTGRYDIHHGFRAELAGTYGDPTRFAGAILHEMMHITTALQYATNAGPTGDVGHVVNMNLPPPTVGAALVPDFGLDANQLDALPDGAVAQMNTMMANWDNLRTETDQEEASGALTAVQAKVVRDRLDYAIVIPGALAHYDTVLTDLLYYLQAEALGATRTYDFARRMLAEANDRRAAALGAVQAIVPVPMPPPPPPQTFWQWLADWYLQYGG